MLLNKNKLIQAFNTCTIYFTIPENGKIEIILWKLSIKPMDFWSIIVEILWHWDLECCLVSSTEERQFEHTFKEGFHTD